ncbi:hypothetical protein CK203_024333 [Vitis vinifera]|uniref:Uncharacterized protein n=1 Tax=Vitis vinifera TaxID=29760 RepID=A0A438IYH0_VITVI|nr:hypothetical protein CK203_024333 [Vitis vinifera]
MACSSCSLKRRSQKVGPNGMAHVWHSELDPSTLLRPIPNSVSGPCLAKLAHRLVFEYCLAKRQETLGRGELSDHIGPDTLRQSPSKETGNARGIDGYNESCVDGRSRKRKRSSHKDGPHDKFKNQNHRGNGRLRKGKRRKVTEPRNGRARFP